MVVNNKLINAKIISTKSYLLVLPNHPIEIPSLIATVIAAVIKTKATANSSNEQDDIFFTQ